MRVKYILSPRSTCMQAPCRSMAPIAPVPGMRRSPCILRQRLLDLDQNHPLRQRPLRVQQVYEAVPLPQAIKPHARPRGEVVPPNLVVAHREAHKRQLLDETRDGAKRDLFGGEVDVAAAVGARAGLVLALVAAAAVDEREVVGAIGMDLRLDVGVEALGGGVRVREGDGLGGEEGDGEGERLASCACALLVGVDVWAVAFIAMLV